MMKASIPRLENAEISILLACNTFTQDHKKKKRRDKMKKMKIRGGGRARRVRWVRREKRARFIARPVDRCR